jgi:PTS system nitrogen regulatory IIA component
MDLTVKDLMELLNVDESKVIAMIDAKKIPVYRIDDEYRFNRTEIKEWLLEHNLKVTKKVLDIDVTKTGVSLTALISRGGVFYNVEGSTTFEVIKNAAEYIPLPFEISRDRVIYRLLEREEMVPTAIGKGIAIPHPREPIITDPAEQSVSICFLRSPIDFKALDREPVHTLFVILSADAPRHLEILSRISYLCHDDQFVKLLRDRASLQEISDYIMIREMEWNEKRS